MGSSSIMIKKVQNHEIIWASLKFIEQFTVLFRIYNNIVARSDQVHRATKLVIRLFAVQKKRVIRLFTVYLQFYIDTFVPTQRQKVKWMPQNTRNS